MHSSQYRFIEQWFTTTAPGNTTQCSSKKSNENCWTELQSRNKDFVIRWKGLVFTSAFELGGDDPEREASEKPVAYSQPGYVYEM